jgi:hypothetical protein
VRQKPPGCGELAARHRNRAMMEINAERECDRIVDPRHQRISQTQRFGELSMRVARTDSTAQKLLVCYQSALRDPDKELVHLYEIWEGILKAFAGNNRLAKQTLGIEEGRLSRLANSEPIRQGRHSGRHLDSLRDVTPRERQEARAIAIGMLVAYLEYRDGQLR